MDSANELEDAASIAEAIGRLASDEDVFEEAVRAFRMQDRAAFRGILEKLDLLTRCREVCDWLGAKECVRVCLEVCGVPTAAEEETGLEPAQFARAIARVTSNDGLLKQLVYAVEYRDSDEFHEVAKALNIERYCHLLCYWVCSVRYRLVCELLCSPDEAPQRQLVSELQAAGLSISRLVESTSFVDAVKAAEERDCLRLRTVLEAAQLGQDCYYLCEWFCSWRCVLVCLRFCRPFPERSDLSLDEMRAFAQAITRLAAAPRGLEPFLLAVERQDAEEFSALLKEHQVERFCLQLCQWLCSLLCRRFCICVCPPGDTIPLFTKVGEYHVDPVTYHDFTPEGTTAVGGYAFTGTIPLIGDLPDGSATVPLEYRFRFAKYPGPGPLQDVVANIVPATIIGQLEYWYWNSALSTWLTSSADYWVNNPGATVSIPQQFGLPLVVPVNKDIKPGGWIEVPRENSLFVGGVGKFIPQGGLANLDTTKLSLEVFDLTVAAPPLPVLAGDSVPVPQQSEKPVFRLVFEARNVLTLAAVNSNTLDKIAISNTEYTYTRHPEWAGGVVTTFAVVSLDLAELIPPAGTGCNGLSDHVHALFTACHGYLGAVSVYLEGPGVPPPSPFSPAPPYPSGGAVSSPGGQDFNISGLRPCAYILWLQATMNLTSGYGLIAGATIWDHLAFCKDS